MENVNTRGEEPNVGTEANATAEPTVETTTETNATAEQTVETATEANAAAEPTVETTTETNATAEQTVETATEANAAAEPIVETATEANAAGDPSTSLNAAAVPEIALFIDDLDGSVTEEHLIEVFDRMGDMESVLVCVDPATGKPLGYGYVCYTNPDDAAKAMAVLNFSSLNGKQIRISYSNREGSISGISSNETVFFKSLDKGFNKKEVKDIFSAYGKVISCAVELDSTGISKGCGYVQFDNEEDVLNATEHLNGAELNGEILYVGPLVFEAEEQKFSKVFVKNFSEWMTEEDLESTFSEFGLVDDVYVAREEDRTSKCFGFVNFENWEDAARSVEELHGRIIDGKKWHVERALECFENNPANLCVKNIDYMINDDTLEQLFSRFGTITSCMIIRDGKGRSKGYGFVEFSTVEEATEAITKMNGKWIGSRHLHVALGERKVARKRRLQSAMRPIKVIPPIITYKPPRFDVPAGVVSPLQPPTVCVYDVAQQPVPEFYPMIKWQPSVLSQEPGPSMHQQELVDDAARSEQWIKLGGRLYPLVEAVMAEAAPKITGMLLEMEETDVLQLMESPEALKAKVSEAMEVLRSVHK